MTQAWITLLAELARAGEVVTGPAGGRTDREVAEGYRHLTRVFAIAAEMLVEKGDPEHPAFTRWMTAHRKMYGDNPGTVYDAAVIRGDLSYVIRGSRGSSAYLGVCLYGTAADGAKRIAGNVDDDELTVAGDGTFELWLGGPARSSDWLPLEPDVTEVMVRQYFVDPRTEVAGAYRIECVPSLGPPPPLTQEALGARLAALGRYVRETVEAETALSALSSSMSQAVFRSGREYVDAAGEATAAPVDVSAVVRVMPTPAIQYSGQWFDDLTEDEALLVEGVVPECRYWSIQLLTRFMESADWEHHPVFLTGSDIVAGADGGFRVVVAHHDPGVPNWIATTGLTSANVAVRALKAAGVLDVAFRRVALADLQD
ncbi:MAG: hypothetical protein M3N21_02700 [Actinomycetota bacterium]|nr:hypothetical protein [Actinomycetota bacterium]